MKTGITILLAGALLGGAIGITMRARQNAVDEALAAQQVAQQTPMLFALPPPSSVALNPAAGPAVVPQAPPGPPQRAYAVPGSTIVAPPTGPAVVQQAAPAPPQRTYAFPGSPVVIPPSPGIVVVPPPVKEPVAKRPPPHFVATPPVVKPTGGGHPAVGPKVTAAKEKAKDKDDDGYTVASAGSSREPKDAAPAREPKEPKPAAKKPPAKNSDDANAVLKAALGATANTL